MHPVRQIDAFVAAPAWTLVWLAAIGIWIGTLAVSTIERIELLSLDAPELPARTWPAYEAGTRDSRNVLLRDPFTAPSSAEQASVRICGAPLGR